MKHKPKMAFLDKEDLAENVKKFPVWKNDEFHRKDIRRNASEAVTRRCSVKKVFLKIPQNS